MCKENCHTRAQWPYLHILKHVLAHLAILVLLFINLETEVG
jgi:hypothetical protein